MGEKKYKILYVDDEFNNLATFKETFRREYQIFTALAGEEGLNILRIEKDIPLIITDQRMPNMTGIQFLEKVIPEFSDTIRMILTAFTDTEALIAAINTGQVYRYIVKPWDENELRITIKRALEAYELDQQNRKLIEDLRKALENERRLAIEKQKMGAYIPQHVVDEISRNREEKLALGGKNMRATIFFSDIEGFTRLSEAMEPQKVVNFLNVYMTAMANIIEEEGGIIDKFIGDGIMAVFTPLDVDDNHSLRAVRSGIRMQQKLIELKKDWKVNHPEMSGLQIRIGINTGEVVAGNIGSETRMDYTVIGDSVNVAARIESICRPAEVYVSESTYLDVKEFVVATKMEPITVKNRVQPVQIYSVREISKPTPGDFQQGP